MSSNRRQFHCRKVAIKLNDEVRLERIRFSDDLGNDVRSLTLSEQCLFLAEFTLRQRARPSDELTQEELSPYLQV